MSVANTLVDFDDGHLKPAAYDDVALKPAIFLLEGGFKEDTPAPEGAAAGRRGVIVASVCRFVAFDVANRVMSVVAAGAAASGGWGIYPPLIFSTLQHTCWTRI